MSAGYARAPTQVSFGALRAAVTPQSTPPTPPQTLTLRGERRDQAEQRGDLVLSPWYISGT